MTDAPVVILGMRDVQNGRLVEVTVSTPDLRQATVTVTKDVASSDYLSMVIQSMLQSRVDTLMQLEPVDE